MAEKTTSVCSLLRYRTLMFGWRFKRIIVFTSHSQSKYENLRNEGIIHEIYHEIPTLEDLYRIASAYKDCGGCIIILDTNYVWLECWFKPRKSIYRIVPS